MAIILTSGATGVSTSSVASALAKEKDILYIVGIDAIRETARQLVPQPINPYLHKSSYEAGKSKNYNSKSDEIKREKIIRGFKTQSNVIKLCVDGIIRRYTIEEANAIIKGVNLIPGDYPNISKQLLIDIEDESIHLARLKKRIEENPKRRKEHINNFPEIRYIRDYLVRKAQEKNIPIIDNSKSLEETIRNCLNIIC